MRVLDLMSQKEIDLSVKGDNITVTFKHEGETGNIAFGRVSIVDQDGQTAYRLAEKAKNGGIIPVGVPPGATFDWMQVVWLDEPTARRVADHYGVLLR